MAFTAERNFRMDLVVRAGELQEATIGDCRRMGQLIIDVLCTEPWAATHLQCGSATNDDIAAATATSEACKSAQCYGTVVQDTCPMTSVFHVYYPSDR